METDFPSEYLQFVEINDTGKTKVWAVNSKSSKTRLGKIKWHGPWRQYTFHPSSNTLWNVGCLQDVTGFIGLQMAARRVPSTTGTAATTT